MPDSIIVPSSWALQQMDVEACWHRGVTGKGVLIGHLDTGLDSTHPVLHGRVADFRLFDHDGNPAAHNQPVDTGTHGTATASLICGKHIGVAPDAQLCSGVVIDGGQCLVRVLYGLDWLLDQNIRVLSMSLGIPGYNPILSVILDKMRQRGVLLIFPIGNTGEDSSCSPGNYPQALAVGSIDQAGNVPKFSASEQFKRDLDNVKPNLVAPGVNVVCASPDGKFERRNGTSMASAYVAGIAALLFGAYPSATVEQVETALYLSCQPHPDVFRGGSGMISADRALQHLRAAL